MSMDMVEKSCFVLAAVRALELEQQSEVILILGADLLMADADERCRSNRLCGILRSGIVVVDISLSFE
jgi:hypothetical protein